MSGITEQDRWEWIDCYTADLRTWRFEWGAVALVDEHLEALWKGVEGEYADEVWNGPRIQCILPDSQEQLEEDIANLDAGEDPTCYGWEDGSGHRVCRENATPVDADGVPLRWIVEDDAQDLHNATFVTYHAIQAEANAHAMSIWLRLTPRERKFRNVYVGYDQDGTYIWDGELYFPDGCWDSASMPEEDSDEYLDEVETVARISAGGTSMQLNLTKELRAMGLKRGDQVRVTLRRVD